MEEGDKTKHQAHATPFVVSQQLADRRARWLWRGYIQESSLMIDLLQMRIICNKSLNHAQLPVYLKWCRGQTRPQRTGWAYRVAVTRWFLATMT